MIVMEEGFSTDGDYKIEEGYFKIVEEAYDFLEDVRSDLLEDVIEEPSVYENRNEIIHELSDILTRHSKIKKYKKENFKVTEAKLEEMSIKSIKDSLFKAKNIKNTEQKIILYERAAESALISAGVYGNNIYINFGKKKYLEASELWKEIKRPAESYIDLNLSKKFEYYAIILNCIRANDTIKKIDDIIMQGEDIIESTIDKVTKDFEDYMRSQNQDNTKILAEEPYLQQLKKDELKKFAVDINIIKERKRKNLFEEKLMNYFDMLRDSYMNKDEEFVNFCISEIKKEIANELGGNSISIFGWPKEQTEDNITRWINAYVDTGKLRDYYSKKDYPNIPKDSKN